MNSEAGPGINNDPKFVQNLCLRIWGKHELKNRSVTGVQSNANKSKQCSPALEHEKLKFIYGK